MSEEIQEAVQIIRVAYDGIEIVMKVGSGGISAMQKAIDFLRGMLDYEKSLGKTSMKKLLMRGGDLQVFQFKTSDMKEVMKLAKKYGILYSVLPDANKTDGFSEFIFHTEALPRANLIIQKMGAGSIASFDDYLKNGDEKSLANIMDFLHNQKRGNDKIHTEDGSRVSEIMDGLIEKVGLFAMDKNSISVDAVKENFSVNHEQAEDVIKQLETIGLLNGKDDNGNYKVVMDRDAFINRIRGYQDLADRMRAISASKNMNLSDVTISKTLIVVENEHAIKTRVPGTWGETARYVWLNKENMMEIHNGKTILTFLDKNKEYKLYDESNRVVETKRGDVLYKSHYDKVEQNLRKHYEQQKDKSVSITTDAITKSTTTTKRR